MKSRFCFAITEPNAGSNSMEITTIAKPEAKEDFVSPDKRYSLPTPTAPTMRWS